MKNDGSSRGLPSHIKSLGVYKPSTSVASLTKHVRGSPRSDPHQSSTQIGSRSPNNHKQPRQVQINLYPMNTMPSPAKPEKMSPQSLPIRSLKESDVSLSAQNVSFKSQESKPIQPPAYLQSDYPELAHSLGCDSLPLSKPRPLNATSSSQQSAVLTVKPAADALSSAKKIQAAWRGYYARHTIIPQMYQNPLEGEDDLIESKAKEVICRAIWNYVLRKKDKERDLLSKYINHCAVCIQKNFRGHLQRRRNKFLKLAFKVLQDGLLAIFKGWKTRRILKLKNIQDNIREYKDLTIQYYQTPNRDQKRRLDNQIKSQREMTNRLFEEIMRDPYWPRRVKAHAKKQSAASGSKVIQQTNARPPSVGGFAPAEEPIRSYPADRPINPAKSAWEDHDEGKEAEPVEPTSQEIHNRLVEKELNNQDETAQKKPTTAELPQDDDQDNSKSGQRFQFLKRKQKYDPRRAIQEEKQKQVEQQTKAELTKTQQVSSNKAAGNDERTIGAREGRFQDQSQDLENADPEQPQRDSENVAGDGMGDIDADDDEAKQPKNFLKRKSKAVHAGKLNWKTVKGRVDCWGQRRNQQESETPERVVPPRKEQPQAQLQQQQQAAAPPRRGVQPGNQSPDAGKRLVKRTSPMPVAKRASPSPQGERYGKLSPNRLPIGMQGPIMRPVGGQQSNNAKMIRVNELEKAYSINFYPKSIVVNSLFEYVTNKAEKTGLANASQIPTIRTMSKFVRKTISTTFDDAVNDLQEHYHTLCEVN